MDWKGKRLSRDSLDAAWQSFWHSARTDISARNAIISHNLALVQRVVNQFFPPGRCSDEMRDRCISLGVGGLMQAIEGCDPPRRSTFGAYAYSRVLGAIRDGLRGECKYAARPLDGEATTMPAPEEPCPVESAESFSRMLRGCSDIERRVMTLRYQDGLLFREIAEAVGRSEHGVRDIHNRALGRLREQMIA